MREESERGKKGATLRLYIEQRLRKKMHSSKKKSNKLLFASIQPSALFQRKDALKIVERRTAHIELALICYKSSLVRMYCRSPYLSLPQG